jgi:hypothetical protein
MTHADGAEIGAITGLGIVFGDEAIDDGLQVDNRNEDTALQSPRGEFCEEIFDSVDRR